MKPGEMKDFATYVEEELMLAPWNWTRSFVQATSHSGFLKVDGPGNLFGKGYGLSYVLLSSERKKEEEAGW